MDDGPDIGEAADYILSERPKLEEDDVMAVLMTLGDPPRPGTDDVAMSLVRQMHPSLSPKVIRRVLKEWREYASLASADDWDDEEG
jgi:hypothetical protein